VSESCTMRSSRTQLFCTDCDACFLDYVQDVTLEKLKKAILHFLSTHAKILILDNVDNIKALQQGGALRWVFDGLGESRCVITMRVRELSITTLCADVKHDYVECFEIRPNDNNEVMEAIVAQYAWRGGKELHFPADAEV
jgi:hypothetical protein